MRICIISDLHFKFRRNSPEDLENERIILSFLEEAIGKYDLLILAGDIFDLWFDWRYTIIKQYFPLLVRLDEIRRAGCRIVHISGNHDFWFNDFLPEYLDIELYRDSFSIIADGKRLHVCHGDEHTVNDLRYRIFRRVIRLPLVRRIFSVFHPDFALGLGSFLSRSSRGRKEDAALRKSKEQGLIKHAQSLITRGKADFVVMGHSHNPTLKTLDGGIYANCGDWLSHYTFIEVIAGELSINYYMSNKGAIQ